MGTLLSDHSLWLIYMCHQLLMLFLLHARGHLIKQQLTCTNEPLWSLNHVDRDDSCTLSGMEVKFSKIVVAISCN